MSVVEHIRNLGIKPRRAQPTGGQLRPLSMAPAITDFADGLARGLDATDDLFDAPALRIELPYRAGLQSDIEALRSDVRKAKAKLTLETGARNANAG